MRRIVPLALLLVSCLHSPSGRRELILVSDDQMTQLGIASFDQMKQQTPATGDPAVKAYVDCVANAITAVSDMKADWEVVVFDEPKTVNAFALPGGKIGVYTGLLQVANTPGQLAAVLGHEVSHVRARHSAERVSQGVLLQFGTSAVGSLFGNPTTRAAAVAAMGLGSQVGVVLPFSRTQESEADLLGQQLMAKAGFDPAESVTLWERMAQASGGGNGSALLSDHPTNGDRQKALTKSLPKAQQVWDLSRNPNCQLQQAPRRGL